eukprot:scaffold128061_cov72-Phaeocystis_antarctica.AAC.2
MPAARRSSLVGSELARRARCSSANSAASRCISASSRMENPRSLSASSAPPSLSPPSLSPLSPSRRLAIVTEEAGDSSSTRPPASADAPPSWDCTSCGRDDMPTPREDHSGVPSCDFTVAQNALQDGCCPLLFLLVLSLLLLLLLLLLSARLLRLRLRVKQAGARLIHGGLRRGAGRDVVQKEIPERRQRAAVERSGEGGAAGVGDLGVAKVEHPELRQYSRRQRRHTWRRRRRHEGGEALVAERVALEKENLQRGQPPQGRREGHQPHVADGGVAQTEVLEPRQGASAQGGGEG